MNHSNTQKTLYLITTANPGSPPAPQPGFLVSPELIFSTISAAIGALGTYLFNRWQRNQEAKLSSEAREQATKLNITEKVFNETFDVSAEIHKLIDAYRGESARAADILESIVELIKSGQQATLEQLNTLNGKVDRLEVGLQIVGCEIQEKIEGLSGMLDPKHQNLAESNGHTARSSHSIVEQENS